MRVAVGSTNPVKVRAVENELRQVYDGVQVIAREVPSGVTAQHPVTPSSLARPR